MTYASTITAAQALLQAAGLGILNVYDVAAAPPSIAVDQQPAVVLRPDPRGIREKRLAGSFGAGTKERDWTLQCHVWATYADRVTSAPTWEALWEGVEQVFRSNHAFGGTADTASSQVLVAGEVLTPKPDDWTQNANGSITRHVQIDVGVCELLNA